MQPIRLIDQPASSSDLVPKLIVKRLQHVIQPTFEQLVQPRRTAIVLEVALDQRAIDYHLVHQLLGQPLQPSTLRRGPTVRLVDLLHGLGHALIERNQRFAQCGLADIANDAGGDFLIGLLAPGGAEIYLVVAVSIQQQAHFAQLLAGEITRAIYYHAPTKAIVFAWINAGKTKCAYESTDDANPIFQKMLKRGHSADDWNHLLNEAPAQRQRLQQFAAGLLPWSLASLLDHFRLPLNEFIVQDTGAVFAAFYISVQP